MRLSPKMKQILIKEIKTAIDNMGATDKPFEKLYYFSAVYGVAFRIINIEYDPELSFIHLVTMGAHNMLTTNFNLFVPGRTVLTFPKELFDKLDTALKELADKIEKNQKTYPVLEKIYNLAYSTSGNGYYLHLKGIPLV